jgi:glycosyltransferase involved in cell wall biosynthesis
MGDPALTVVVPAHDEAAVIGRLLTALGPPAPHDTVVVVCDGCTDATADIARRFAGVQVVEQARGGKPAALNAGDQAATGFPRFYVDADIQVGLADLRAVARRMISEGRAAGAPRMRVDTSSSSWPVRRFYDIWTRLPYATDATLGSGVFGLTEEGRGRFDRFPDVIGDDEYIRRLFALDERVEDPPGTFVVTPPRHLRPLVRIKTRSRLGIAQLDSLQGPAPAEAGDHGSSVLPALARQPRLWPSLAVFVGVRLVVEVRVRVRRRRGAFGGWARDESSRLGD